jgi:hypothetical protein
MSLDRIGKTMKSIRLSSLLIAVVGVLFFIGGLYLIECIQLKVPDKFERNQLPENAFFKLKIIFSGLFLLVVPSIYLFFRSYLQLGKFLKGDEEALHGFRNSLKWNLLSLLIAWSIITIVVFLAANFVNNYLLAFRNLPT